MYLKKVCPAICLRTFHVRIMYIKLIPVSILEILLPQAHFLRSLDMFYCVIISSIQSYYLNWLIQLMCFVACTRIILNLMVVASINLKYSSKSVLGVLGLTANLKAMQVLFQAMQVLFQAMQVLFHLLFQVHLVFGVTTRFEDISFKLMYRVSYRF